MFVQEMIGGMATGKIVAYVMTEAEVPLPINRAPFAPPMVKRRRRVVVKKEDFLQKFGGVKLLDPETVPMQCSVEREKFSISADQEYIRSMRNMTHRTVHGPGGVKKVTMTFHHSHGKHGRKPRPKWEGIVTVRVLYREQ
jgi:hypothetical protein